MPRRKKKWAWQYSWAKEILRLAIIAEDISPEHTYDEIHGWHPEVEETDRAKLPGRVRGLRKQISTDQGLSATDEAALDHDRKLFPIPEFNYRGEPRWEGSSAQRLLKEDIKKGAHLTMTPEEFYYSRPEYTNSYGLTIIRQHIYQEVKFVKYCDFRNDKKKSMFISFKRK